MWNAPQVYIIIYCINAGPDTEWKVFFFLFFPLFLLFALGSITFTLSCLMLFVCERITTGFFLSRLFNLNQVHIWLRHSYKNIIFEISLNELAALYNCC